MLQTTIGESVLIVRRRRFLECPAGETQSVKPAATKTRAVMIKKDTDLCIVNLVKGYRISVSCGKFNTISLCLPN